ncbi:unnamed protein product [Peniophora sp. CBMAI 1063]|nr:unnamed protein product [Peniophora sp. CBMAI 1063]
MTLVPEDNDILRDAHGLHRDTDSEHLAAWSMFWGKEIEVEEQVLWTQWRDDLDGDAERAVNGLSDLACAVGVLDESDSGGWPPCRFIKTPWKTTLAATRGCIMTTEDYTRIDQSANGSLDHQRRRGTVTITGQSGCGRTYLAHYMLARALSRRQSTLFYCRGRVTFFHNLGVFSGSDFRPGYDGFRFWEMREDYPRLIVDVDRENDQSKLLMSGMLDDGFMTVRLHASRSHSRAYLESQELELSYGRLHWTSSPLATWYSRRCFRTAQMLPRPA